MQRATSAVRLLAGDKEPVRLASTANLALSGLLTVDSVVAEVGDRVLVKNQTDPRENGIYTASEGVWYRAPDSNRMGVLRAGMKVAVQEGATQGGDVWSLTTDRPDLGEDDIEYVFYLSTTLTSDINALVASGISEVADAAADILATAWAATNSADFASRAAAIALSIPAGLTYVRTAGYYAAGDGGHAIFEKGVGIVNTGADFQSADGAYWNLVDRQFTPQMFGAYANGSANDTAAMQAAHNTGRLIYYPKGTYIFTSITMATGGIIGDGFGQTILTSTDATSADLITYTGTGTSSQVPTFSRFLIQAANTKAAGAGIVFLPPGGGELGFPKVSEIGTYNIPFGLDFRAVAGFKVHSCEFLNYSLAGVKVDNTLHADSGDSVITGCTFGTAFTGGPSCGILQLGSGGLKIVGNKMLGGDFSYRMTYTGNITSGDLLITGNSMEQATTGAIVLERSSGPYTFGAITIIGNQIAITPIGIYGDTSGFLSQLAISGNVIAVSSATGTAAINIGTASILSIVGNTLIGRNSGDVGIITGGGCSNGKIGGNLIYNFASKASIGGTAMTGIEDYQAGNVNPAVSSAFGSLYSFQATVTFSPVFQSAPEVSANVTDASTGGISVVIGSVSASGFVYTVIGITNGGFVPFRWVARGL